MLQTVLASAGLLAFVAPYVFADQLEALRESEYLWLYQSVCLLWFALVVAVSVPWGRVYERVARTWHRDPEKERRLGLYDHDERIDGLWRKLNLARNEEYKALRLVGPVARLLPSDGKSYDRQQLRQLRWRMWGRVWRLEAAAKKLA